MIPAVLLAGARRDYPIEALLRDPPRLEAGDRTLLCWALPPWQRPEVWDDERKRRFVEGVFLGLGTGYYVVNGTDYECDHERPMSGWLLDGQQRMAALRDFIHNGLAIFDGVRHADLDALTLTRRFYRVVFPSVELEYCADEARLRELYERLAFGGVPHDASDRERFEAGLAEARPREGRP